MCGQSVTGQSFRGKDLLCSLFAPFGCRLPGNSWGSLQGNTASSQELRVSVGETLLLIQLTCVFLLLKKGPFTQLPLSKWPSLAGPLSYYHTKDTAFPECPAVQSNCSWLSYNLSIFSISSFYRLF